VRVWIVILVAQGETGSLSVDPHRYGFKAKADADTVAEEINNAKGHLYAFVSSVELEQ
jgi:hypothetical protein